MDKRPSLDSIFTPEVISGNAQPRPSLDSIFNSKPVITPPTSQPLKGDTGLGGFSTGIGKGIVSSVKGAGQLGESIFNAAVPKSIESHVYDEKSLEADKEKGGAVGRLLNENNLEANGTAENIGKFAEKSAEYLVPATDAAKGTSLAARVAAETLSAGTIGSVQSGKVGKDAALSAGLGAVAPFGGSLISGAGRVVSKGGSTIAESVIPTSSQEAKLIQTYKADKPFLERMKDILSGSEKSPETAAKTAVEQGLMGTKSHIGVQAKRGTQTLWNNVISPSLKKSDKSVDLNGFFSTVEKNIVKDNPELSRQKSLLEALDAVKEDYDGIHNVSLEKLQKLKEGWAKFVPDKAYKGKPIGGAFNDVRNELSGEARTAIYNELGPEVKKAYIDYGNLIGLKEYGQAAMTGAKLKGGAGSFVSELASAALTPVATIGGQAIYRLGNGIEFVGKVGAKNIAEALGIPKTK